jgi:Bacterial antitoxin of type II TA system, VapB
MRVTIDIDDELLMKATDLTGLMNHSAVVDEGTGKRQALGYATFADMVKSLDSVVEVKKGASDHVVRWR